MAAKKSIPYQFEPVSWALFLENCTVHITVLWTASITNVSVRTQWYLTEEDGIWFPSCPCTRPCKLMDSSCLLDNGRLIYFRNVTYGQLLASCFLENPRVFAAVHMKSSAPKYSCTSEAWHGISMSHWWKYKESCTLNGLPRRWWGPGTCAAELQICLAGEIVICKLQICRGEAGTDHHLLLTALGLADICLAHTTYFYINPIYCSKANFTDK